VRATGSKSIMSMCRQLQIFEKSTVPYVMASGRINAINVRYLHDRCSSPSTHRWQQTRLAFSQKPSIASRTTRSEIGVQVENQMGGQGKDVGPDSLHLIQSSSMEWIPFLMCPVNDPTRLAFELRCSTSPENSTIFVDITKTDLCTINGL